jgi:uroporphyrinogen-III synthase
MRVLVTRPAEDAPRFIKALTAGGHRPIWSPSLVMRPVEGPPLSVAAFQAILITSANAVRALASHTRERETLLLCVGPASAATARELGFVRVQASAGEGVPGLIDLAQRVLRPNFGPVLYPSAADVAGNLPAELDRLGFKVERQIVYRMELAQSLSSEAQDALSHHALDVVTYFSARSVNGTRQAAEAAGLRDHLDRTTALGASAAVAAVAKQSHKRCHATTAATEAAMLQAIDRLHVSGL